MRIAHFLKISSRVSENGIVKGQYPLTGVRLGCFAIQAASQCVIAVARKERPDREEPPVSDVALPELASQVSGA